MKWIKSSTEKKCKRECQNYKECKFIFANKGYCKLFEACDEYIRYAGVYGIIYAKDKCPGTWLLNIKTAYVFVGPKID